MSIVYGDFHAYPNMGCLSIGRVLLDSSMFSEYFTTFDNIGVGIEGVPATQTGQAHFILHYDKRWRYDSVLFDQLGTPVCALEVVNTHYSNQEKIDSTRSNNQQCMGFAEFMADDVLESTNGWLHNIRTLQYPDCPRCKEIAAAAANPAASGSVQSVAAVAPPAKLNQSPELVYYDQSPDCASSPNSAIQDQSVAAVAAVTNQSLPRLDETPGGTSHPSCPSH